MRVKCIQLPDWDNIRHRRPKNTLIKLGVIYNVYDEEVQPDGTYYVLIEFGDGVGFDSNCFIILPDISENAIHESKTVYA